MSVFTQGNSVDTTGLGVIAPKDVQAGKEYIWEYWTPAITFAVISPETLNTFITGLFNLDSLIKKAAPGVGSAPIKVTGVTIDTASGNIWIRGQVVSVPVSDVEQAGVNPLAIAALVGTIFAIIGVAVSLRYVYEVSGGTTGLDACSQSGPINYLTCLYAQSRIFVLGVVFGIVALVVFLLVKFGPKGVTAA
jgi:hypothetical protein